MAPVIFKSAQILLNGVELTGALNDLGVTYNVEMLDATTFGADTRIKRGGLFMAALSGKGFFDSSVGIEAALYPNVGVDDVIIAVFPDGVVEGAVSGSGAGYAMRGELSQFTVGAAVGQLLAVSFAGESRGLGSAGQSVT